jgi:hypothetical protein
MGEEQAVEFEIRINGHIPPRKQLAISGWGKLLAEFVWNSRAEEGLITSPIIVNFRDQYDYREQRFRFDFNSTSRTLNVVDEYPNQGTTRYRVVSPDNFN